MPSKVEEGIRSSAMELQIIVNHCTVAKNRIPVLWKSSHLFSLHSLMFLSLGLSLNLMLTTCLFYLIFNTLASPAKLPSPELQLDLTAAPALGYSWTARPYSVVSGCIQLLNVSSGMLNPGLHACKAHTSLTGPTLQPRLFKL